MGIADGASAGREDRESGGVELGRGGRDGRCGGIRGTAGPIGDDAAGTADDGDERSDVPWVHDWIERNVGPAAGEQQVAVAIAPSADEFRGGKEAVAGGAVLIFGEVKGVAREQGGFGETGGGAATDVAAAEGGRRAVAEHELTEDGLVDAAEHGLAVMEEGDERAEERHAGDKGLGAVDGIKDPDEFCVGVFGAEFFTDDAVAGEFFADELAEKCFGATVGDGDGGGV